MYSIPKLSKGITLLTFPFKAIQLSCNNLYSSRFIQLPSNKFSIKLTPNVPSNTLINPH